MTPTFPEDADTQSEKSLWEELAHDHARMRRVLEDVLALANAGSYVTAARRFGEFRIAQERHLHAEEKLLELLQKAPGCPACVQRMRDEHKAVLALLEDISRLLSSWEVAPVPGKLAELVTLLRGHESGEQEDLFPQLERTLADHEAYRQLLAQVAHP